VSGTICADTAPPMPVQAFAAIILSVLVALAIIFSIFLIVVFAIIFPIVVVVALTIILSILVAVAFTMILSIMIMSIFTFPVPVLSTFPFIVTWFCGFCGWFRGRVGRRGFGQGQALVERRIPYGILGALWLGPVVGGSVLGNATTLLLTPIVASGGAVVAFGRRRRVRNASVRQTAAFIFPPELRLFTAARSWLHVGRCNEGNKAGESEQSNVIAHYGGVVDTRK